VPPLGRRGFTLAELLVALALFGIVAEGIYRVLVSTQRISQAQAQRIELQQTLRGAAAVLPVEFRELDAADGDIHAMAATAITIRAMRQLAFVCRPAALDGRATDLTLTIRAAPLFGLRGFNPATDSLLIYYESDMAAPDGNGWALAALTAVADDTCADGAPGRKLSARGVRRPEQPDWTAAVPGGAPVRGFEVVTYRLYPASDGRWYLGMRGAAETQPLAGPLSGRAGLSLAYYDATGAPTAVPTRVALIEMRVRGQTADPVRRPDGALERLRDSLVTWVALRNNRR